MNRDGWVHVDTVVSIYTASDRPKNVYRPHHSSNKHRSLSLITGLEIYNNMDNICILRKGFFFYFLT